MMGKMTTIVLVLCIVYQMPLTAYASVKDPPISCAIMNETDIEIRQFPESKYSGHINFGSYDLNISSINGVWEPCYDDDPPLTDNILKQIRIVLRLLRLTNEEIPCEQLNKLLHLGVNLFPFDYYYHLGQVKQNAPASNQSLCEYDLESLQILQSPSSINKVLRNESFCAFTKLKNLTIGVSDISAIEDDAFVCLEQLIEIKLHYDNLTYLPERVFRRNQRLQTVILRGNRFTSLLLYSVQPLANVLFLDLSRNQVEVLSEVIPLKRLKHLDLRGNKLREINGNAFSELVELEDIDLSENQLEEVDAETFRNSPRVKRLVVSRNALKSIPKIDNLWKLEVFDVSGNKISGWINMSDFFGNNHVNIKDLKLNSNRIEGIAVTSLKIDQFVYDSGHLPRLRIDLSNNFIQSLSNVILLERVNGLDMRNNRIRTVCLELLDSVSYSSIENAVHLSGNPLRCNCINSQLRDKRLIGDFEGLECDLVPTPLDLKKKPPVQLAKLEDDQFLCRVEFNSNERCVCNDEEYEECAANDLEENCHAFTDWEETKIINVCENLTEIPIDGYYTKTVTDNNNKKGKSRGFKHHMYFTGNNIKKLKLVQFVNKELSNECVSFYLENSNVRRIEKNAFNQLSNLRILSLRNNRIRVLPDNLFRKLTKLKELYLSNNRLIAFPGQMINNVIKLELHNNSLTRLPISANTNRLLLSSSNLTYLSLHNNPWSCECDFIQPFHNYLGINADIVQRVKEIKCIDEQRNKYNVLRFDLSKCKLFLHLTAVVTSTTFAIVIIIISALIFIYRREVRVLIYSRYRLRIFGSEVEDDVSNKQYDAFVAYNCKDEDFLINHLMPGLEAIPNPYRLCIHQRDFPAGAFIQESIMRAVELSSRTIVVLTENFVDSGWCRMEFMTAHAQMMEDRCPRVLLIVLGEIPRDLDPEMEVYMKTNTYLRWGERLFWEKLYYAMPDQRVTAPATEIMPMDYHEELSTVD